MSVQHLKLIDSTDFFNLKEHGPTVPLTRIAHRTVSSSLCNLCFQIILRFSVREIRVSRVLANRETCRTHSSEKRFYVRTRNWTTWCPYPIEKRGNSLATIFLLKLVYSFYLVREHVNWIFQNFLYDECTPKPATSLLGDRLRCPRKQE